MVIKIYIEGRWLIEPTQYNGEMIPPSKSIFKKMNLF